MSRLVLFRSCVRPAVHPSRSVTLGSPSWPARRGHFLAPSLSARVAKAAFERYFASAEPTPITDGNVLAPPSDGARIDGGLRSRPPRRASLVAGVAALGAVVIVGALLVGRGITGRRE